MRLNDFVSSRFSRRTAIFGAASLGVSSLAPWGWARQNQPHPGSTIPMVDWRIGRDRAAWKLSPVTRIVTDDAWHAEAKALAADFVAMGLMPVSPEVASGKARAHDIALRHASAIAKEGYAIDISRGQPLVIEASEACGIYYAGRTLLQSLLAVGRALPVGHVADQPDRPNRGVTVDVGRKYYSPAWLRWLIAEMGWLKLNELHLHLSDNEGFGYASALLPQLASPQHLSLQELRDLVAFAAQHHVAIVPEVDAPGHMGWLLKQFPDLALKASDGKSLGRAIDVSLPAARNLVEGMIDELLPIFPGPNWHLGGDEVLTTERPGESEGELDRSYPQLVSYAAGRVGAGATAHDALSLYLNDQSRRLQARGKRARAWNDGMQARGRVVIDPMIDVDYWENLGGTLKTAAQHIADGHRVLNAHSRFLYYVIAQPPFPWYPNPVAERIYGEWEIAQFEGQPPMSSADASVLGAHLSVWADRPGDRNQETIATDLYRPLRALAQRIWSDRRPAIDAPTFSVLIDRVGPAPQNRGRVSLAL